jgi:N-formylglutamate deformylase
VTKPSARHVARQSRAKGTHKTCLVADSPHSGRHYPADFKYSCDKQTLRQAEDAWIDKLFDFLPDLGVPFLQAQFPRSYIDANRDASKVVADFNKAGAKAARAEFVPVESGLIRSPVTPRHRVPVYKRKLSLGEAFNRVSGYHKPYHDRLARMLDKAVSEEGRVVHLNCHSMPSSIYRGTRQNKYDIILGTRDGETADAALADKLRVLLEAKGYVVGMNIAGFRGAEIVRRYGKPEAGRHSIQIEINRALYMNEKNLHRHAGMQKLKSDLQDVIRDFRDICDATVPVMPQPQAVNPRRKYG